MRDSTPPWFGEPPSQASSGLPAAAPSVAALVFRRRRIAPKMDPFASLFYTSGSRPSADGFHQPSRQDRSIRSADAVGRRLAALPNYPNKAQPSLNPRLFQF